MSKRTRMSLVLAAAITVSACLGLVGEARADCGTCATCCGTCSAQASPASSIPEVAKDAGSFGTLLAAIEAAGLGKTLAGEGPFTVFAPTDDAFAKLPEGTVEALLEKPERLKSVLLHHVVPDQLNAKKVAKATALTTAFGQPIAVESGEGGVLIGGARVVQADVAASNGIIHAIDHVLLPKDLVGVAAGASEFTTLVTAVKKAGLVEVLKGDGPFTLFAPTNEAFAKLPAGTIEGLLEPENRQKLQAILKYHVVPGTFKAADVVTLKRAKTAAGGSLNIQNSRKEGVRINQAKVLQTDIMATNGVIHVIDSVILPSG